jgi:hypothetical protein
MILVFAFAFVSTFISFSLSHIFWKQQFSLSGNSYSLIIEITESLIFLVALMVIRVSLSLLFMEIRLLRMNISNFFLLLWMLAAVFLFANEFAIFLYRFSCWFFCLHLFLFRSLLAFGTRFRTTRDLNGIKIISFIAMRSYWRWILLDFFITFTTICDGCITFSLIAFVSAFVHAFFCIFCFADNFSLTFFRFYLLNWPEIFDYFLMWNTVPLLITVLILNTFCWRKWYEFSQL